MGVFEGYVAPAARAAVAASQYNEYILEGLLFCTNRFADFLSLTLKVNACFRWMLRRLPLGESEDFVQRGQKCFKGWKYVNYYTRVQPVLRAVFALSLAVYPVMLPLQWAPSVLLRVCGCVEPAAVLCRAVTGLLGSTWGLLPGCWSTTRALADIWDPASF